MSALRAAVSEAQSSLDAIYRLDLGLRAEQFLVSPECARSLLRGAIPRSGLVVIDEGDAVSIGLYLDPQDCEDVETIVEETSHFLCVAWHAAQDRSVSRLVLELQAEVDRYAVARLAGRDGLSHFRQFSWATWMDDATRELYQLAHRIGERYCRFLSASYPDRSDTPGLLQELRRFYRAPAEQKLQARPAR